MEPKEKTLKEQLDELNTELHKMEDVQVLARVTLALRDKRFADEKIVLMNNIAMEKDDVGKPMYSNDTKRQAAFREAMVTGHPLRTLEAQLNDDRTKIEYSYNELGYLKRKFQILLQIRGDGNE